MKTSQPVVNADDYGRQFRVLLGPGRQKDRWMQIGAPGVSTRVLAPLALGLVVGCATSPGGGCGSPPQAADAAYSSAVLLSYAPPCIYGIEAPRGSNAHLIVSFTCPGESDEFLVAVKVDDQLELLQAVRCAGYGSTIVLDAGSWEPPDTTWHDVEVVLDLLNLFKETDESNNRGSARIRIVEPDASLIAPECGFRVPVDAGGDGWTLIDQVRAGTLVEARLSLDIGGPYPQIARSVRSGPSLDAADTVSISCDQRTFFTTNFITRWLPPGPGVYDVEFRIQTLGPTTDRIPTNNVLSKRLTVTSTGAPPFPALARSPAVGK